MGQGNKKSRFTYQDGESSQAGLPQKRVKGQLPLAGCRDSVPAGVWGNAPTVPRATSMSNASNKGRRQRSVPAPNFARPQTRPPSCSIMALHIVAPDGRDRVVGFSDIAALFWKQGDFASAEATRGLSGRPLDPFGSHPCFLIFLSGHGGIAPAGATTRNQLTFPALCALSFFAASSA